MKLKICGLKTLDDVQYVNEACVDYAGFVFAPSPQQITAERAKELRAMLNPEIKSVGVFVDESFEFIKALVDDGVIDVVQFHGDCEYPMSCPTVRAFRMQSTEDIKPTGCDFALFDAFKSGVRGSTGGMFDWRLIDGYSGKPFFLAGGINISNLAAAMELNPYCIDISSGVEIEGKKSRELILEVANECKRKIR
jgi:phosphoribosylanthranilate isomerase